MTKVKKKDSQTFLQHRLRGDHVDVNAISIVFLILHHFDPRKTFVLCQIRLFFFHHIPFFDFFFYPRTVVDFSNFPKDS